MASLNILAEAQAQDIRDRFFKMTNIDLYNLDPDEIDRLLTLLPLALVYIHETYSIAPVDGNAELD